MDRLYTNGMIAVKEKTLLGERLRRLCEGSTDEAFRLLLESGFGSGAEVSSPREFELLTEIEHRNVDAFIRTYAPSEAVKSYFFYPRDFHNVRAAVKAEFLSLPLEQMLAPEGTIPVKTIVAAVQSGDLSKVGILADAIEQATALFREENGAPTGVQIGSIFEKALFAALKKSCARSRLLSKFVAMKADMTNLLTAFRAPSMELVEEMFVTGGKLSAAKLSEVFTDTEGLERELSNTALAPFLKACIEAKRNGVPYSEAERMLESFDLHYLNENRFTLKGNEPFIYYVLRRRAECDDVRIVFVCLNAGMTEVEIKKRLRSTREGL